MGRAAHNWKRRQKLLEKHGGHKTDSWRGSWKDSWNSKWTESWSGSWKGESSEGWSESRVKSKAVKAKKGHLPAKPADKAKVRKKVKKDASKTEAPIKKVKKKKVANERDGAVEPDGSPTKRTLKRRKLVKRRLGGQPETEEVGKTKRKRVKGRKREGARVVKVAKVAKKRVSKDAEQVAKKGKKVVIKKKAKFFRHFARVICPGSLTERFVACGQASTHAALTAFERAMLASGPLSWRWLRDQDEDLLPPKSRPLAEDSQGHWKALAEAEGALSKHSAARLRSIDAALDADALFPPCSERVSLASRLRPQGALRRRCERYMEEVLLPLLEAPSPGAFGHAEESTAHIMAQARQLLRSCAGAWLAAAEQRSTSEELDVIGLRRAWLQMLCRSLVSIGTETSDHREATASPEAWAPWLAALRQVQLARLCPRLDADTRLRLLRTVTLASPEMERGSHSSELVVLPLGLFTYWQSLALVAVVRRVGCHAMLVRRQADGTPQVLFRTSEMVLSRPQE